jgi:UDP-N-acetylmuramate dehydrogenase
MIVEDCVEAHPLQSAVFLAFASRLRHNVDLSRTNWFRVGGQAEWLFRPESVHDLVVFLEQLPRDIPVTVLGVGSNVIIRDGGIDGVVIKLGRGFVGIDVQGTRIKAGAGLLVYNLAHYACEQNIAGLEFMSGVPGTVGGVVRMNAGAYENDTAKVLVEAEIIERDGTVRTLKNSELGFSYRKSNFPPDAIVVSATFEGHPGDRQEIAGAIKKITDAREVTQPIRTKTGGSTFKNPPGRKAWELIEEAGCRGLQIGGARVSQMHCNFLINTGEATATDLENLGEEVRRRVLEKTGVELEWEIKRIGKPA